MRKRVSRRDFLRLSATFAAGTVLAACAPQAAPTEAPAPTEEPEQPAEAPEATEVPEPTPEPPPAEKVKVRLHERTVPFKIEHWEDLGAQFMEEHPSVEFVVEPFPPGPEYNEKILTMVAGKTIGDIVWSVNMLNYGTFHAKNIIEPLNPWIEADGYDLSPFFEEALDIFRHEGQLDMIPTGVHGGPFNFFYNADRFEEVGVEPPTDLEWTYDDLLEMATKLADPEKPLFGYYANPKWGETTHVFIRSFGGDSMNEEGTESRLLEEPVREAFRYLDEMINELQIFPRPSDLPEGGYRAMFQSELLATFSQGPWDVANLRGLIEDEPKWDMTLVPEGPAGRIGQYVTEGYFIPSVAEQKDWAWEYVKLQSTLEDNVARPPLGFIASARSDGMLHPSLMEDPMYALYHQWLADNPQPPPALPANLRNTEVFAFLLNDFDKLWLGEGSVDEVLEEADAKLNNILQMPEP